MNTKQNFSSTHLHFVALEKEHLLPIHRLHCCPEVAQFNTIGVPKHLEETTAVLAKRLDRNDQSNFGWAVFNSSHSFVGEAGLVLAAQRFKKAEISYSLLPDHWNKGLGTEMTRALLRFCFDHLGLHRVEAGVAIENRASIRVLEKAGMRREGHHRKILPLASGWADNYSFAILKEDWTSLDRHR